MIKFKVAILGLLAVALLAWALPAAAHRSAAQATLVTVTAGKPVEFKFRLSKLTVPHGVVTFKVTNSGALPHDFKVGTKKTRLLTPGSSQTISVNLAAGKASYLCTVTGHAAAGMKGTIRVT